MTHDETAIEKKLRDAGYKLLGDNTGIELVLDILKTRNERYLKAIPFLIYKYDIDIAEIRKKADDLELLNTILDIARLIFSELGIKKKTFNSIRGDYRSEGMYAQEYAPKLKEFKKQFKEFKEEFELQLRMDTKPELLIDKQKMDEERNLQYNLSQLFTKKEKQMIRRLQENKPLSRTEYEYYSRKTRKKLRAIRDLEDFAKNIYAKMPTYDEILFELKKYLETWISKKLKNDSSIEEFLISRNKIFITFKNISGESITENWKLNEIKDNKILHMLEKYQEHDFR